MNDKNNNRGSFSGKLGFVLSAAGASVGLGNIWRFPYLAAKYGGGIFLLVYILLALTFGYTMIIAETVIGRSSGKSPVSAFRHFSSSRLMNIGGWLNAIVPVLIVPYYSVIGGWVCRYLYAYLTSDTAVIASDTFFSDFIANGASGELWFLVFTALTLLIIFMGVQNGIEKVSKLMMPVLIALAIIISLYAMLLPGAMEGVKYFLIPNFSQFSLMTVVTAMEQMFYSLSIAMGILITFGSYMKKDVSIEDSTRQVEFFDTAIAVLAGLMIIPAVFSFSGNSAAESLKAGPSLMFITMPKIFAEMSGGRLIGILFFLLVLLAALTSAIALSEAAVSVFSDEFGWSRKTCTSLLGMLMVLLGTLSCLGYGPLSFITIIGMPFLDFFDFLTNSVMMPLAALAICVLINRYVTIEKAESEVQLNGKPFRRRAIFRFMIRFLCPVFILMIFLSSILTSLGLIVK